MREKLTRAILCGHMNDAKELIRNISKEELNDYIEGEDTVLHDMCYIWSTLGYDKEDEIETCELLLSKLSKKVINLGTNSIYLDENCSALDIAEQDNSTELIKLLREAIDRIEEDNYE